MGESSRPGVVIPFPRSILCHQLILLISSIKAAVGAAIETLPEMRCATGPDRARGILENGPRVNSKITRARELSTDKVCSRSMSVVVAKDCKENPRFFASRDALVVLKITDRVLLVAPSQATDRKRGMHKCSRTPADGASGTPARALSIPRCLNRPS